jgi:integrase
MPRKATGQLYENRSKTTGKVTSYGVRFRYAGKRRYVTLAATTRKDAEREMAHLIADVQRGLWTPPEDRSPDPEPRRMPTFAEAASDWYRAKAEERGWRDERRDGPVEDYCPDLMWRLGHLRSFGPIPLDRIGVEDVDRYRRAKVREERLSPSSINKTIATLAAILEVAVEYGYVERNVAKGKRRRLKAPKPERVYLARADHIAALLDAAGKLDAAEGRRTAPWRRALLATLVYAGPRINEALELRWKDLDLAGCRLRIRGTKTDAAARTVELLPTLRDELASYAAARRERRPDALIFGTSAAGARYEGGRKHSPSNIRNRVIAEAVKLADAALADDGIEPLPAGIGPHALRRTFASLLVALGRDPAVVMRQMGHTTPHFTLSVYARRDGLARRRAGPSEGLGGGRIPVHAERKRRPGRLGSRSRLKKLPDVAIARVLGVELLELLAALGLPPHLDVEQCARVPGLLQEVRVALLAPEGVLVRLHRGFLHPLRFEGACLVDPDLEADVVLVRGAGGDIDDLVPGFRFSVEVAEAQDEERMRSHLDQLLDETDGLIQPAVALVHLAEDERGTERAERHVDRDVLRDRDRDAPAGDVLVHQGIGKRLLRVDDLLEVSGRRVVVPRLSADDACEEVIGECLLFRVLLRRLAEEPKRLIRLTRGVRVDRLVERLLVARREHAGLRGRRRRNRCRRARRRASTAALRPLLRVTDPTPGDADRGAASPGGVDRDAAAPSSDPDTGSAVADVEPDPRPELDALPHAKTHATPSGRRSSTLRARPAKGKERAVPSVAPA